MIKAITLQPETGAFTAGALLLTALLACAMPANATTLEEALALATAQQPALGVAQAGQRAALAAYDEARAARWPSLSLQVAANRVDDPAGALFTKLSQGRVSDADLTADALNGAEPINDLSGTLILHQSLYSGGRTEAQIKVRREALTRVDAELLGVTQNTRLGVTQAYLGHLLSQEAVNVVAASRDTAHTHLQLVENRVAAGTAVRADQLAAEAHLARLEGDLIAQQRDLALARVNLTVAVGAPLPSAPSEALPTEAVSLPALEGLIAKGLAHHPSMLAAAANQRQARYQHRESRGARMPNLALDGTLSDHRPSLSGESGQVWQVGVNLNWQLLDGGARKASLRRAQAGLKIALLTERQTRVQVRADVTRAHTAAKAAQGRIVTAKSGVSAAQAWVTLARDRYELGVALLTDLQEAEDRLNESRLALLTARHDLAVAHARLVAATGGTL